MHLDQWTTSRWSGRLLFLMVLLAVIGIALQLRDLLARQLLARAIANQGVQVIDQVDAVFDAMTRTLAEADQSPHAACSPLDLRFLRSVFVHSKYVKDLGRLEGSDLGCTTMLGVLSRPFVPRQQPLVLARGVSAYWTVPLLSDPGTFGMVLRARKSNLLVDLDAFRAPLAPGLHYVLSLKERQTPLVIGLDAGGLPGFVDAARVDGLAGGARFCSRRFPFCATVLVTEAARARARATAGGWTGIAGGVLGAWLGWLALRFHRRWRALPARMRRGLERERFTLRYQPIVALGDRRGIVSAEALIRWTDGPPPDVFIAAAERGGVVADVTAFVIRTVLVEMRDLFESFPDFRVTVNVSSPELLDGSLTATLDRLWPAGLSRTHVGFELTERSSAELEDILPELERLRWLGHSIYMDDFGTGYSSLSQLQHLPIDYIKVDRSLLPEAEAQLQGSILPEILAIARRLEMGVVFEGVETAEQARMLACADQRVFAQGWYFGRPDTVEALTRMMTSDASGVA